MRLSIPLHAGSPAQVLSAFGCAVRAAVHVQRLGDEILQHLVVDVRMRSQVADDAQDEHVERLVDVLDAYLVQRAVVAHRGVHDVRGHAVGHAVHEVDVKRRVLVRGQRAAERVVLEHAEAHELYDAGKGAFDVARVPLRVPVMSGLDEVGHVVVEDGRGDGLLVREVMVEQRARHAHAVGDVLHGGFREPLLLVQLAGRGHDVGSTLGRCRVARLLVRGCHAALLAPFA